MQEDRTNTSPPPQQIDRISSHIIRPEIERIKFKDFIDNSGKPVDENWGWCNLQRLRIAVIQYFFTTHPNIVNDPAELFDRYGLLNGHVNGVATVTWASLSEGVFNGNPPPWNLSRSGMVVPAAWALKVCAFAEKGYLQIESVSEAVGAYVSAKPMIHWRLNARKADDTLYHLTSLSHGEFRLISHANPAVEEWVRI